MPLNPKGRIGYKDPSLECVLYALSLESKALEKRNPTLDGHAFFIFKKEFFNKQLPTVVSRGLGEGTTKCPARLPNFASFLIKDTRDITSLESIDSEGNAGQACTNVRSQDRHKTQGSLGVHGYFTLSSSLRGTVDLPIGGARCPQEGDSP